MVTPEQPPQSVARPVVWVGAEELPVHFVNQLVGVVHTNEIFLTIGTLVPPAIVGDTIEERRAQAQAISFIQVKPVVRLALTPEGLRQFIETLQNTLANYERQQRTVG